MSPEKMIGISFAAAAAKLCEAPDKSCFAVFDTVKYFLTVLKVQDLDEQQPRQSVVRGHGDKVVDRRDQRTGGHGGVDAEALEEDGHGRANDAREQHGHQQRRAGAKRHREGKGRGRAFAAIRYSPIAPKDSSPSSRPFIRPTRASLPTSASFCRGLTSSSISTRMVTASDCVPTFPAMSSTSDWKQMMTVRCVTTRSNSPTTARDHEPEPQQDHQPRQTLGHAAAQRLLEIFSGGQTAELCIVLAELVGHELRHDLRRQRAAQAVVGVEHRDGVLGIGADALDAVLNQLVRVDIGVGTS